MINQSMFLKHFFGHSVFTWNQIWRIQSLKICHFNTFRGSKFGCLCIFALFEGWFLPNWQNSEPLKLQKKQKIHVKSKWQKILKFQHLEWLYDAWNWQFLEKKPWKHSKNQVSRGQMLFWGVFWWTFKYKNYDLHFFWTGRWWLLAWRH